MPVLPPKAITRGMKNASWGIATKNPSKRCMIIADRNSPIMANKSQGVRTQIDCKTENSMTSSSRVPAR